MEFLGQSIVYQEIETQADLVEKFKQCQSVEEMMKTLEDADVVQVVDGLLQTMELVGRENGFSFRSIDSRMNKDEQEEKAENDENQVIKGAFGSGFGYSGRSGDDNQELRRAAQDKKNSRDVRDSVFATLFQSLAIVVREKLAEDANAAAFSKLNYSSLNAFLVIYLREASIMELKDRVEIYRALLDVCTTLSANPNTVNVLHVSGYIPADSVIRDHVNVLVLLKDLAKQADLYLKGLNEEDLGNEDFLTEVVNASKETSRNTKQSLNAIVEFVKNQEEAKYDEFELEEKEGTEEDNIRAWLSDQKFRMRDLSEESFYYQQNYNDTVNSGSAAKMKRLRQEVAMLSNSLPDGIYVCVNEDRFDKMKVLIMGPHSTPYEMGAFVFDLYLPPDYPQVNPQMKYMTTGSGTFYFNPNLYTDGKICLSLLGTWDGPGWDPETSTLLQLLVSIQALVFVDYPYENEPGYEGSALSETSLSYNKGIHRANSLYAMQWHLRAENSTSPACFKDIIQAHFYLNREYIKELLAKWDAEDEGVNNYCSYFSWENTMLMSWEDTQQSLNQLFDELECPSLVDEDDDDDDDI